MHVSSVNTITGAQYYFKSPRLYWKEKVESLFKSKLNPQNAHIQCCRPKSPVTKTKSTTENKVLPITLTDQATLCSFALSFPNFSYAAHTSIINLFRSYESSTSTIDGFSNRSHACL